jgi:hypothetical protein
MAEPTFGASGSSKPVILLAFANDRSVNDLPSIGDEFHGIRRQLENAPVAGWEVVAETYASIDVVLGAIRKYRHRIAVFHYGGHAGSDVLLLEGEHGREERARSEPLAKLLGTLSGLKLVFLNGCSTQPQAQALVDAGVPAVITTVCAVNDPAASAFAVQFYAELANGETLSSAFENARNAVRLSADPQSVNREAFLEDDKASQATTTADSWQLRYKDGAESVANWRLPQAAGATHPSGAALRYGIGAAAVVATIAAAAHFMRPSPLKPEPSHLPAKPTPENVQPKTDSTSGTNDSSKVLGRTPTADSMAQVRHRIKPEASDRPAKLTLEYVRPGTGGTPGTNGSWKVLSLSPGAYSNALSTPASGTAKAASSRTNAWCAATHADSLPPLVVAGESGSDGATTRTPPDTNGLGVSLYYVTWRFPDRAPPHIKALKSSAGPKAVGTPLDRSTAADSSRNPELCRLERPIGAKGPAPVVLFDLRNFSPEPVTLTAIAIRQLRSYGAHTGAVGATAPGRDEFRTVGGRTTIDLDGEETQNLATPINIDPADFKTIGLTLELERVGWQEDQTAGGWSIVQLTLLYKDHAKESLFLGNFLAGDRQAKFPPPYAYLNDSAVFQVTHRSRAR